MHQVVHKTNDECVCFVRCFQNEYFKTEVTSSLILTFPQPCIEVNSETEETSQNANK